MIRQSNEYTCRENSGMLKVLRDKYYLDDYRARCAGIERRPESVQAYFKRPIRSSSPERLCEIGELRLAQRSNFLVRSWRRILQVLDRALDWDWQKTGSVVNYPAR